MLALMSHFNPPMIWYPPQAMYWKRGVGRTWTLFFCGQQLYFKAKLCKNKYYYWSNTACVTISLKPGNTIHPAAFSDSIRAISFCPHTTPSCWGGLATSKTMQLYCPVPVIERIGSMEQWSVYSCLSVCKSLSTLSTLWSTLMHSVDRGCPHYQHSVDRGCQHPAASHWDKCIGRKAITSLRGTETPNTRSKLLFCTNNIMYSTSQVWTVMKHLFTPSIKFCDDKLYKTTQKVSMYVSAEGALLHSCTAHHASLLHV